jgi:hypothetical protein
VIVILIVIVIESHSTLPEAMPGGLFKLKVPVAMGCLHARYLPRHAP